MNARRKGKKGSEAEVTGPAAAIRSHCGSEVTLPGRTPAVWGKGSVVEQKRQGFELGWRSPSPDRPSMKECDAYVHESRGDRFCACSWLGKAISSAFFYLESKRTACPALKKKNK